MQQQSATSIQTIRRNKDKFIKQVRREIHEGYSSPEDNRLYCYVEAVDKVRLQEVGIDLRTSLNDYCSIWRKQSTNRGWALRIEEGARVAFSFLVRNTAREYDTVSFLKRRGDGIGSCADNDYVCSLQYAAKKDLVRFTCPCGCVLRAPRNPSID